LTCVSNLSSVVTGSITLHLTWHYLLHLMIVAVGFQTICCIFLVPETCYIRDPRFNEHLVVHDADTSNTEEIGEPKEASISRIEGVNMEPVLPPTSKKTFWQGLAVFTGVYSEESLFKLVFAPFLCCLNLAAFWTVLITGAVTSFYVAIAYTIAQLFSPPAIPAYDCSNWLHVIGSFHRRDSRDSSRCTDRGSPGHMDGEEKQWCLRAGIPSRNRPVRGSLCWWTLRIWFHLPKLGRYLPV
jgi:hypothetical protein